MHPILMSDLIRAEQAALVRTAERRRLAAALRRARRTAAPSPSGSPVDPAPAVTGHRMAGRRPLHT
ncbi:hypothetical protein ACNTMW_01840 [Planosporangium sp. 12N6]|uniref:hypothetical protein n=1 Tax=Planosporangium spinosum TaxID=3402278 RepID=UPI003CE9EEE1